ncbi:hypothetical protein [Desulfitobacterium sp.]|nr:hypothetical protein [Desulfitobacterium sp.]HVJ48267.1 hypothetical protein [Desulfitobacterium sp.]
MKRKPLMNIMGSTVYPLGDKDPIPSNKDKEDEPKEINEHVEKF